MLCVWKWTVTPDPHESVEQGCGCGEDGMWFCGKAGGELVFMESHKNH